MYIYRYSFFWVNIRVQKVWLFLVRPNKKISVVQVSDRAYFDGATLNFFLPWWGKNKKTLSKKLKFLKIGAVFFEL